MIGIFDSGIGGLTVAKEFFKYFPNNKIVYFGDSARLPYGTKSKQFIENCSEDIVRFLLKKGAKAIVIACHTASALAADHLRKKFKGVPIFEIVTPGVEKAARTTKNKRIGVIGTPGTINSEVHKSKLLNLNPDLKVYDKSCPLFVPLVEEGWVDRKETRLIVEDYLSFLKKKEIDTLVLACTHYPLLKKGIADFVGKKVTIINPAEDLAINFRDYLVKNKSLAKSLKVGNNHSFFVSDRPYNFQIMSRLCLGREVTPTVVNI